MRTVLAVTALVVAYVIGRVFGSEILSGSDSETTDGTGAAPLGAGVQAA